MSTVKKSTSSKKYNIRMNWLAALAAIPISLGIQMVDTPFNWLLLVPIFYICLDASRKQILIRASIFGTTASVINFFWLMDAISRYSQTGYLAGILMILAFALFFSVYASLIGLVYYYLIPKNRNYKSYWFFACLAGGSLGVLLDWSMEHFGSGFAMCLYLNYIPAATNLYAIQPASLGGPFVITFFGAMLNYLIAEFIKSRQWKMLMIPFGGLILYLGWGAIILHSYQQKEPKYQQKTIKATVLSENMLPEESWNESNGNQIARDYFQLEQIAIKSNSQLALWSESAVPWSFRTDDDFLKAIDSLSAPAGVTHLIGINTEVGKNAFYNSIYCVNPGMKISGRYDKRIALYLAEKPLWGLSLPFLTFGKQEYKEGTSNAPLRTPYGYAGMVLCNESVLTQPAWSSVREGANFLVNPGNDGWFAQTYVSRLHFYYARMRAVETRKDIVINNNNGFSGLIKSTGEIAMKENNEGPKAFVVDITPNTYQPLALKVSNFFVISALVCFIAVSLFNILVIKKRQ
ncbi:MAG: apolipoprotein N-acyltransferase [Pseudopedobacter saltans]|uniref:Apolipoprotein N-acyltransferase n=1 Tax=Pseudopedobacter saltans TaxID=151895 RepID=A0A2W5FC36_9SPHI|nr:MAG: apolipoprotein N-acyltransferase [Pseudopedobacter saltans]